MKGSWNPWAFGCTTSLRYKESDCSVLHCLNACPEGIAIAQLSELYSMCWWQHPVDRTFHELS